MLAVEDVALIFTLWTRRKRRAMSLLVHGDARIAEIAERLDFCDAYHFSKRFKALTGLSPHHYRSHVRRSLPI